MATQRWPLLAEVSGSPPVLWLRKNLAALLTLAAILSAILTYAAITGGNAPLGMKPKRVLFLLIVNGGLLALLIAIIGKRLLGLWASLRAGSAGSKLQKRILVLFS